MATARPFYDSLGDYEEVPFVSHIDPSVCVPADRNNARVCFFYSTEYSRLSVAIANRTQAAQMLSSANLTTTNLLSKVKVSDSKMNVSGGCSNSPDLEDPTRERGPNLFGSTYTLGWTQPNWEKIPALEDLNRLGGIITWEHLTHLGDHNHL